MMNKKSECWEWLGHINDRGYGMFYANGKNYRAHRVSYVWIGGNEIPNHLVLDHKCRNRKCVNPSHLEAVPQKENILRGSGGAVKMHAKKTHCPNGHPYSLENTYIAKIGGRYCRACRKFPFRKGSKFTQPQRSAWTKEVWKIRKLRKSNAVRLLGSSQKRKD